MSLPKSIVKINRSRDQVTRYNVTFTNSVDRCNYAINELCRGALRDVAKLIIKEMKAVAPKRTKNMVKGFAYWNRTDGGGLQIGTYYSRAKAEKAHRTYVPYFHLVLFPKTNRDGIKSKGNNFFKEVVYNHVDDIRKIEAQYLSAIEDEIKAEQLTANIPEFDEAT